MNEFDETWLGFDVKLLRRAVDGVHEVTFWTRGMIQLRGLGGEIPRVPTPAYVEVRQASEFPGGFQVVGFYPPERDIPRLTRADYEAKALSVISDAA